LNNTFFSTPLAVVDADAAVVAAAI